MELHNPDSPIFLYKELFAELGGFVLCDPQRLTQYHDEKYIYRSNLLQRYTETEEGDQVCMQGIVIPILNVEPDFYTLVIRYSTSPSYLTKTPYITNQGFILGTETGQLLLCRLGSLMSWDPASNPKYYIPFDIPPGWYTVEVQGGIRADIHRKDEYIYEFILTASTTQPVFTANLNTNMNLWQV